MLFLVNQNDVPSVGRIVKVSAQSEPSPEPNAAPTAAFLGGCGGVNCNFADKSTDPDGNLTDWAWTFGDGETSNARDPSHAYLSGGTYTVRLTAKDSDGETSNATRQVTVPGPAYPLGLTVTTSSTSTKHVTKLNWTKAQGSTVYLYRDGLVVKSTANDGVESIGKTATGAATYVLKVCEAATTICSNPATAQFGGGAPRTNMPPNAAFTPGCTAADCRFSDGSTDSDGSVTAWRWDFGDGGSSTQRNPSHTFSSSGTYQVRLTVTDDQGAQGATTRQVTVGEPDDPPGPNASPVADFTASCTALTCGFTDHSTDPDGSVALWSWTFGDGGTSTARNPSHSYAAAGDYTVTLTATDDDGATQDHSATVSVSAPPPSSVTLTVTGSTDAEKHFIKYFWSGISGPSVDLYREGQVVKTTENDGKQEVGVRFKGTATWHVKVCQTGSTTVCSPERSITLSN
jgi:PKD repeat protein